MSIPLLALSIFSLRNKKSPNDVAHSTKKHNGICSFEYFIGNMFRKERLSVFVNFGFLIIRVDDEGKDQVEENGPNCKEKDYSS